MIYNHEINNIGQNSSDSASFSKNEMSELCDYYDMCLFQKATKTIYLKVDQNQSPSSYVYAESKMWNDDFESNNNFTKTRDEAR